MSVRDGEGKQRKDDDTFTEKFMLRRFWGVIITVYLKNFKSDHLAQNLVHIDFEDLQVHEFHSLAWQARKMYQIYLYHQVLNSVMKFIWIKNGQPFAFLITDCNFLLQDLQISLFLVC